MVFVNTAGFPVKPGDRLRLADGETVEPPGVVYWTPADGPATNVPLSKLEYEDEADD
jgi:hypothetical protein